MKACTSCDVGTRIAGGILVSLHLVGMPMTTFLLFHSSNQLLLTGSMRKRASLTPNTGAKVRGVHPRRNLPGECSWISQTCHLERIWKVERRLKYPELLSSAILCSPSFTCYPLLSLLHQPVLRPPTASDRCTPSQHVRRIHEGKCAYGREERQEQALQPD